MCYKFVGPETCFINLSINYIICYLIYKTIDLNEWFEIVAILLY